MDINPLIADENGAIAVDARIVIDHAAAHGATATRTWRSIPIRSHLDQAWQIERRHGRSRIRPIRPEDAEMEQEFVQGLSRRGQATSASWTRCAS